MAPTRSLVSFVLSIVGIINAQEVQYNLSASAVLDSDNNCNLSVSIWPSKGTVTINMTGPDSLWFGVGFGTSTMKDAYSIVCAKSIVNKSTTPICQENKLSATGYGKLLDPGTITVISDSTKKGVRSVSMTRNITISGSDYFSFPTAPSTISTIHAIGTNDTFTASTPHMGPGGPFKLVLKDGVSNNLTAPRTPLGASIVLNSMTVYPDQEVVQINMTGPGDVYFGIGFNSTKMGPSTYSIICDDSKCHENQFSGYSYGTKLGILYSSRSRWFSIPEMLLLFDCTQRTLSIWFRPPRRTGNAPSLSIESGIPQIPNISNSPPPRARSP